MATATTKTKTKTTKKTTAKKATKKRATPKKNLVIVESPAKAKTIEKYLGRNYKVVASVGHIRDLKKSSMSIDFENNYEPQYINIRGKGPLINELKKEAKKATQVTRTVKGKLFHGICHIFLVLTNMIKTEWSSMKSQRMRLKMPL